jgi:hypothetical protein
MTEQTSGQALDLALKRDSRYTPPGVDLRKQMNLTIAENALELDLGKFADTLPSYRIDQETRDRLIAHARRDAAEAVCSTRNLIDEIYRLKSEKRNLAITLWIAVAVYWFVQWSNSGFALWPWLNALISHLK